VVTATGGISLNGDVHTVATLSNGLLGDYYTQGYYNDNLAFFNTYAPTLSTVYGLTIDKGSVPDSVSYRFSPVTCIWAQLVRISPRFRQHCKEATEIMPIIQPTS